MSADTKTFPTDYEFLHGDTYKMDHTSRGSVLIISIEDYSGKEVNKRNRDSGRATHDIAGLSQALQDEFDYDMNDIEEFREVGKCKKERIKKRIKRFLKNGYRRIDCLIVVILAIGEAGVIFAEDGPMDLSEIIGYFKSENGENADLADKPKVFIISTEKPMPKEQAQSDAIIIGDGPHFVQKSHQIPVEANFLIYTSLLQETHGGDGSLFITCLVKAIREYGRKHDFLNVCTAANYFIANHLKDTDNLQIPAITSQLLKELQFTKKV